MARLPIPKGNTLYSKEIYTFLGADMTDTTSYMDMSRSPDCQNMIRESTGKVRKWIGWHTVKSFDGRINGIHGYRNGNDTIYLVHAGTKLYQWDNGRLWCSDMADVRSVSKQLDKKLFIADGNRVHLFAEKEENGTKSLAVEYLSQNAYVPTVVISRSPSGGGKTYEAINLVGAKRRDSFLSNGTDRDYQLSATQIDAVDKVEKLYADGSFSVVPETGYTVDKLRGRVTFSTAPESSPVQGEDNIKITYIKQNLEYLSRIDGCSILTAYGVDGASDRIFASGNEVYPNRDYFCQMDNPSYWPDINYCIIGGDNSRIMGYSIINNALATHLDKSDTDTNIVLRQGVLNDDGDVFFKMTNAYQGRGAVSQHCFGVLETEQLFLTQQGVMAITPSDVLGEKYAQLRSYYLNGGLLKENLSDAVSCTYDRFYMLAVGDKIYALDGTQSTTEPNQPYSKRQYSAFFRTNVPARILLNMDGVLTFGTVDGRVCQFYTDYTNIANFNDDGAPIDAHWTTPEIHGQHFYCRKRFKQLSAIIGSAVDTGVKISAIYDGVEEKIFENDDQLKHFAFSRLSFSKFTFRTDTTAQIIREKISIKPDNKKVQFLFKNDNINQPFALYGIVAEYTESR